MGTTRDFRTRVRGRREFYIYTQFPLLWHIGRARMGGWGVRRDILHLLLGKTIQERGSVGAWERVGRRVDSISNITIDATWVTRLSDKPALNRYIRPL